MHTLVLIRHAKATSPYKGIEDTLRPIAAKGYQQLEVLAQCDALKLQLPDRIYVSPSVRTYTTAIALMSALGIDDDRLHLAPALYEASGDALWQFLRKRAMPSQQRVFWLVGHAPGLDELVALLSGQAAKAMKPGAVAVLQSEGWMAGGYQLIAEEKSKL